MYQVVDLFAGAGGLSLGFMQTNKFKIKVAFENNPAMQQTYMKNHPEVDIRGDVCSADYKEIQAQYGDIDVVIGGPPCQGFSNANRQKNHAISQNNMLVKQYIRAICELQPKAFVMENVSMLRSHVHRFYLDEYDNQLITKNKYNIPMKVTKLVLLEKEYYFSEAIGLVQSSDKIIENLWPEEYYSVLNVIYKTTKNIAKLENALVKHKNTLLKYAEEYQGINCCPYIAKVSNEAIMGIKQFYDGCLDVRGIKDVIEPAIFTQRMLRKAKEIFDNHLVVDRYENNDGELVAHIRSYAVFDYLKAILESEPNNYEIVADILCAADYGVPQKRKRFVVFGMKKRGDGILELPKGTFTEECYRTVRDAIEDLEEVRSVTDLSDDIGTVIGEKKCLSELGKALRDTNILYNHIITKTGKNAMERFKALKQGQNFHSLDEELKSNTYTDVTRTQNTIYLRLNYDRPCGTVVNVRKSMWVHPVLDRAISVREAARLQTFPDSYVFCGTKDRQYQQVGNAVPPVLARAIAEKLAEQLDKVIENGKN